MKEPHFCSQFVSSSLFLFLQFLSPSISFTISLLYFLTAALSLLSFSFFSLSILSCPLLCHFHILIAFMSLALCFMMSLSFNQCLLYNILSHSLFILSPSFSFSMVRLYSDMEWKQQRTKALLGSFFPPSRTLKYSTTLPTPQRFFCYAIFSLSLQYWYHTLTLKLFWHLLSNRLFVAMLCEISEVALIKISSDVHNQNLCYDSQRYKICCWFGIRPVLPEQLWFLSQIQSLLLPFALIVFWCWSSVFWCWCVWAGALWASWKLVSDSKTKLSWID